MRRIVAALDCLKASRPWIGNLPTVRIRPLGALLRDSCRARLRWPAAGMSVLAVALS
jgi:hypothetical protein